MAEATGEVTEDLEIGPHPGRRSELLRRRITRPSRLVIVPSSSAHCVVGSTTSASAAVSERKKSPTTSRSSFRSPPRCVRFGAETTRLEPITSRASTPGSPRVESISYADAPGPGSASGSTFQMRRRAPRCRVVEPAVAGELVGLLSVLAATLAVALAGEAP